MRARQKFVLAMAIPALILGLFYLAVVRPLAGTIRADPLVRFEYDGVERSYRIHLPEGEEYDRSGVLVVALHGGGQEPHLFANMAGLNRIADQEGHVVVYPAGQGLRWNDGLTESTSDDIGFLREVVKQVTLEQETDRDQVFLTGLSDGAVMAHRFACETDGVVRAVAVVAGHLPEPVAARCTAGAPTAVLEVAGTADRIIPFDGVPGKMLSARRSIEHWAARNGCPPTPREKAVAASGAESGTVDRIAYESCPGGADAVLLAIDGGGHTWPDESDLSAADEVFDFFDAHSRSAAQYK